MTDTKLTPKAKADKLAESMMKGREILDSYQKTLENRWLIAGKTMAHWRDYFRLEVPYDNITPAICRELAGKLIELHQEASFFYAVAQAKTQSLKKGAASSYYQRFGEIVDEYKQYDRRLPAAQTLEAIARTDLEDVDQAAELASMENKFWKTIVDDLYNCRKLIETVGWSIRTEMQYLNPDPIERTNNDRTR